MLKKPKRAADYKSEQVALVRATCLYVATKLGDLMEDLVIVGGLVPSLLIDQEQLPEGVATHVGTMDLDVGMTLALLDQGRYRRLTERLRDAGFTADKNDDGNLTRQRWKITGSGTVTVDFLIPPSRAGDKGGALRDIEPDFAALIAPGLRLAFQDRLRVTLDGLTLFGEKATREVWVCGVGAFILLKALAFDGRGEGKDAYDLFYVLQNYGAGVEDVATKLRSLVTDAEAQKALSVLRRDFQALESVGPRRVAEFMIGGADSNVQADVVGYVRQLLNMFGKLD